MPGTKTTGGASLPTLRARTRVRSRRRRRVPGARRAGAARTGAGGRGRTPTPRPPPLIFSRFVQPGSGKSPGASDVVRVHYHGSLTDGTVFDSSVQRGQPAEFPLNQVLPCWTEGVQRTH